MKTRATEVGSSKLDALENYVQKLDQKLAQVVKSVPVDRARIESIALDAVGMTLDTHADAIKRLQEAQAQKGSDGDSTELQEIREEISALKGEIKDLQSSMKEQFEIIWNDVFELQEAAWSQKAKKKEKGAVQAVSPQKRREKGSSHTRSSRKKKASSSRRTRKRRGSDVSDSGSESSDSRSESDEEDEGDIYVADDDCREALKVETYRLKRRDPERDTRLKTVKVLTTLKHLFDGEKFGGEDPLTALHFLEEIQTVFDDAEISEGDARHMFRYFLTGEALRIFKGLTNAERDSYPKIVRWILRTYVRENLLQEARDEFFGRSQKRDETEQEYADALRELTRRCVGMLSEKEIVTRFVRGLNPAIRTHVRAKIHKKTSWADAIVLATEYGNSVRETRKADRRQQEKSFGTFPKRKIRAGQGTRLMAVKTGHIGDESSDDQLEVVEEVPDPVDADPVSALPWRSHPMSRDPSLGSIRSSGASSAPYYTPKLAPSPQRDPPFIPRKVILPPGVPYPQRNPGRNTELPCLGCSKRGHWIADCRETAPETRELILEALRARKVKRAAANAGQERGQIPAQKRAALMLEPQSQPAGRDVEDGEVPPEEVSG